MQIILDLGFLNKDVQLKASTQYIMMQQVYANMHTHTHTDLQ